MTLIWKFALATTFIVVMTTGAHADEEYDQCMADAVSNPDWAKCGGDWIAREDAKLNATWEKLYGAAAGQTRIDLLATQRLWIPFRESACKFYSNGDWGREGRIVHAATCEATVISDRTKELEGYLQHMTAD